MMRDRVERFAVLPFSMGCSSQSSVAVATRDDEFKKPKSHSFESAKSCGDKMKDASVMVDSTKNSNITDGIYKLIRGFKSFSQLLIGYKEEMEEMEETEAEMEIGLPTDVKHVTHVGLDGTMTGSNAVRGWESLFSQEITSLPSFPFGPLELSSLASHSNKTSSVT